MPLLPTAITFSRRSTYSQRQFQHQRLVERWQGQKVEAVEALHRREVRLADAPFDHPPFALDQFQFREPQQIADMVDRLRGTLPGDLVVVAQEAGQLQRLQVMGQQDLRRIRHAAAPVIRAR
jgi:hypothetical protein